MKREFHTSSRYGSPSGDSYTRDSQFLINDLSLKKGEYKNLNKVNLSKDFKGSNGNWSYGRLSQ